MSKYILVIDEGTTSTRAIAFDFDGNIKASAGKPLKQYYPASGLVEHDAEEIWTSSLACITEVIETLGGAKKIATIGITNQRETVVFWNRKTGKPLTKAIVWQDRRTADFCEKLKTQGLEEKISKKTGLLLDPYFSGSKIHWAMQNLPALKEAGENLCLGTIESYLIFRLTGGLHISDATNAARTLLMDIEKGAWDEENLEIFGAPKSALPEITDCAGDFGICELFGAKIPISGMAGDQQAATIGQACLEIGQTKSTYGTGAFVLTQTGGNIIHSKNRLLSTILYSLNGQRNYALEGSVFVAGSLIAWVRDALGLLKNSKDSEKMAREVDDNGGVYVVAALSGLGAPYWNPNARGLINGLSFSTNKNHIIRACLEAMAHQTHDLMQAFQKDGASWKNLRIDGGMSANNFIAQDLADILNIEVSRPDNVETTALGAAMLAGIGAGIFKDLLEASKMRGKSKNFVPFMNTETRNKRLKEYQNAIKLAL